MVKARLGQRLPAVEKREAYRVQPLRGVQRIRDLLSPGQAYAVFALGCLEPHHFQACEWWLAEGAGASALLMHARTSLGPSLFALGDSGALEAALRLHPGPIFTFATFQLRHLPVMERHFSLQNRRQMQRMVVTRQTFQPVAGPARRLLPSDLAQVNRLYGSAGGHYTRQHLEEGVYHGVLVGDGRLVAIAGTHIVAPGEGVAVVGNVYTQPRHRGRGYATLATSAVTAELLARCPLVALTVDPTNTPAVRAYRKLGYQPEGLLMESAARRGDLLGLASLARRWLGRRRGDDDRGEGESVDAT